MLGRNMLSMSGLSLYRNAVQFGMNIVVAATIAPANYGLIVFTSPFLVLLAMLTDFGISSAIVRTSSLSSRDAGAAWGAMLIGGGVSAGALALSAWPLERAVAMPGLAPVMASMAGAMLLAVAAATPRAMLERRLRYGRVVGIEAAAIGIGAAAGIGYAVQGGGVWSLVLYNVLMHGVRLAGFAWTTRSRLRPWLDWARVKPLVSFGGWVLVTNLVSFAARNGDNLLIGAWLGAGAVGIYGLSYQFMLAPLMAITWPTSAILLSTLRGLPPASERAQRLVEGVLSATALVSMPAMAYLTFGLAWPVAALLSPRWAAVPVIVAWLAPAGALQSIASYNGALLLAAGRPRTQFFLTLVSTAALLATFLVSLPFGLMTLVHAYVVTSMVTSVAFLATIVALTGMTWHRLACALGPALMGTGFGLAAVRLLGGGDGSWSRWAIATATYGVVVLAGYAALGTHLRRTATMLTSRLAVTST